MNKVLLLCVVLFCNSTLWSQLCDFNQMNIHPIAVDSLNTDNFEDLDFLKTVLKDRRIVCLGESAHGVKDFNQAKLKLIKFLHQEMGFKVLAFEYDMDRQAYLNEHRNDYNAEELLSFGLYPCWQNRANLALMDYIKEQQDLTTIGFDSQFYQDDQYSFLSNYLKSRNKRWAKQFEKLDTKAAKDSLGRKIQLKKLNRLKAKLSRLKRRASEKEKADASLAVQILGQKIAYWSMGDFLYNYKRDSMMAAHLIWSIEQFPSDEKIIVWAHNAHLAKKELPTSARYVYMGEVLSQYFKEEYYVLGLDFAKGTGHHRFPNEIAEQDLEAPLYKGICRAKSDVFYLDMKENPKDSCLYNVNHWLLMGYMRQWDYSLEMPEKEHSFADYYDGLLLFKEIKAPDYLWPLWKKKK